jgi:hypothetical protein
MDKYLRLITNRIWRQKKFSVFDWTEDWILIKNNPVDFIIDGYTIEKQM